MKSTRKEAAEILVDLPKWEKLGERIAHKVGKDSFGLEPHQFDFHTDITQLPIYEVIYNGRIDLRFKVLALEPEFEPTLLRETIWVTYCRSRIFWHIYFD